MTEALTTGYIELIDTNTGGGRVDVTPPFADRDATYGLSTDLAQPLAGVRLDLVAGIDALGFILGSALASVFQTGFLAITLIAMCAPGRRWRSTIAWR